MRVLLTADPIGGVSTYALELCAALAPHGVEVAVATLGGPIPDALRHELTSLASVTVHESRFRLEWMADPWEDLALAADWLLELERRFEPDVIHLNHLAHGDLPWQAPVLVVGHSCVLSWWTAVHGCPPPRDWDRYRDRVTLSLRAADAVAAPTRTMLSALRRHYGPLRRTCAVLNGRSASPFHSVRKEPLVLTAGRLWDEAKNLATLAAAAPEVHWPIVAAGAAALADPSRPDEPPPSTLSSAARAVQWLGPLSPVELAGWYARAAVYALPARYEPFGLTALEAAHSGCALVLGDIASLREVWGDAAWYVAPDDRAALRDALNRLAADPAAREALADRARERARALTPGTMAASYLSIYRELLGRSAEAPVRKPGPQSRLAKTLAEEHHA
jgi:glycogen synthase